MPKQNNAPDGTLSLATQFRIQYQGFKIRMLISLVFSVLAMVIMFVILPPKTIRIVELGDDVEISFTDLVKWELAERNILKTKYPAALLLIAELQDDQREQAMQLVLNARVKYLAQYIKHLLALIFGFIVGYILSKIISSRESKYRSEDQYVRGAKILPIGELNKLTKANGSRLAIAGVSVPTENEVMSWGFVGRPRVGKTVGIKSLLDQSLACLC